jgi:hypothetical protein
MICRVCDGTDVALAIDLGLQSWCNHFLKKSEVGGERFHLLRVVYCHRCATAQLDFTVPKEIVFGDHTYPPGVTNSLRERLRKALEQADWRLRWNVREKSILCIGSSDGTQLKHYQAPGYEVLDLESSRTLPRIADDAGVDTVNNFSNTYTAVETCSRAITALPGAIG